MMADMGRWVRFVFAGVIVSFNHFGGRRAIMADLWRSYDHGNVGLRSECSRNSAADGEILPRPAEIPSYL